LKKMKVVVIAAVMTTLIVVVGITLSARDLGNHSDFKPMSPTEIQESKNAKKIGNAVPTQQPVVVP